MKNDINKIKQKILPILQSYGVRRAALFGSSGRGKMHKDSDVEYLG
jgi:predicted nucleotidyltransferase